MRTIYRTHFELGPKSRGSGKPTFEAANKVVSAWATSRPGTTVPSAFDFCSNQAEQATGSRSFIETRFYEGPNGKASAVRLRMPDEEPDVEWATETVVHENAKGELWFSCVLSVGRRGLALSPVFRPPNCPGVVSRILSQFVGKGLLSLTDSPLGCGESEVEVLLRLLESPSRHHPIVFIAQDREGELATDPSYLARQLGGVAYLVVATAPEVSEVLGDSLGSRLNCFDGGARIYWPGFDRQSLPFHHPLWIKARIQTLNARDPKSFHREIFSRIAAVSAFTTHPSYASWSKVFEWQRAQAIEEARAANNQDELLELFEADNKALAEKVARLEAALAERTEEANRHKTRADNYEQALRNVDRSQEIARTIEINLESVADALEQAEERFGDRLVFDWNTKSEAESSPFQKPPDVFEVLEWLATVYFNAQTKRIPCADFDVSVRESVEGWSYEPHQSKGTMKNPKHRAWYLSKSGFELREHLKCGSNKDPRYTIRIAFAWDPKARKVILGYLGQHQQNAAT